jgi:predicted membrane-bound spermidine synthase
MGTTSVTTEMNPKLGRCLLALFVLSGFAGLIYQSVWSHYLGLTLGHAAYAQSLVLAIYMGGMALGAWLVSLVGVRWRRLIMAYAVVEASIGVIGVVFHEVFVRYIDFSQNTVLPAIGSDWMAQAWQWLSSTLLIAPQSVLLGMTFPLMSAGYLRVARGRDGEILGGLYFTNSIGAAFGALACTFVMLPWIGMPGAVRTAGALNLVVALLAAGVARALGPDGAADVTRVEATLPSVGSGRVQAWMLTAAFVTGATSFVYEIGWVRLLNQVLGTTVHSFELMLAAFILGLASGGLWIRYRSARIQDPVSTTGYAQVLMGIAAMLSVPVFARSFGWIAWLMNTLPRTSVGYDLFAVGSAVVAMLVMYPAAFFAGMTLPLMTVSLLRRGLGEASIGRVYAANTLGAIVGVFLMMHGLIPLIGVRLAVMLAAFGDVLLGLALLRLVSDVPQRRGYALSAVAGFVVLAMSLLLGRIDPGAQVAGVYRSGKAAMPSQYVRFLRDGKTATVGVYAIPGGLLTIATNGKADASIQIDPTRTPTIDETTMRMGAALPLGLHPHPRDIAVIGWGSGMTTATLLSSTVPRTVDTIEIEPAMYDGARLFGSYVERGYTDLRSHPRFEDARTYFSTGNRRFDVIFSEPSNPWVSGVASLFTTEFYRLARWHLRPDGLMVQWLHTYELNDHLLSTMVAALVEVFPHVDAYQTNNGDLLFVAGTRPLRPIDLSALSGEPLRSELAKVGLVRTADYDVRRIGSERVLKAFARYTGARPHSDFYPVVSLEGPRARFMLESANLLEALVDNGMPVLDVLDRRTPPAADAVTYTPEFDVVEEHQLAGDIVLALKTADIAALQRRNPTIAAYVYDLLSRRDAAGERTPAVWYTEVSSLAAYTIGILPASDLRGAWIDPAWQGPANMLTAPEQAVLDAFDAAARREAQQMGPRALRALRLLSADKQAPALLREQMLVLAMLGTIAEGRPAQVGVLERDWGSKIPTSSIYGPVRGYLTAWASAPSE